MRDKKHNELFDILLVEDSLADVRLMREALSEEKVPCNIHVAGDGEEAISFLRRQGHHAQAPRPDLILLDLNIPKIDGREVLREIKNDEKLKMIPIIVLTVSRLKEDILTTYQLHANCNINKPLHLKDFMKVAKFLRDFWFTIVTLPPKE